MSSTHLMASALRMRASRQAADPASAAVNGLPVIDDVLDFRAPARPSAGARRSVWPRWLQARRVGLALSITAGMVASAIGGALLAKSLPAAGSAPAAAAPIVPAVSAASAVAAPPPHPAVAASHMPAETPAAPATEHAAPPQDLAHEPSASAASASAHEAPSPPAAHIPSGSAPEPAAVAQAPASTPAPAVTPAEDLTFGLDLNGDGIPDALERYVRKTISTPATRVAARHYYRVALPLATRAQQGDVLPHADKQAVFRAAECYLLTATEDDVPDPPNLNDRAILIGVAAADRMQALAEALAGFEYKLAGAKRQACG